MSAIKHNFSTRGRVNCAAKMQCFNLPSRSRSAVFMRIGRSSNHPNSERSMGEIDGLKGESLSEWMQNFVHSRAIFGFVKPFAGKNRNSIPGEPLWLMKMRLMKKRQSEACGLRKKRDSPRRALGLAQISRRFFVVIFGERQKLPFPVPCRPTVLPRIGDPG
jgi:hypothetical protein